MARWKLTEPHYLMVPENYWEQTETDRATGKQKKKKYPVPTHLDPKDPGVWTHKSGERHISQGGNEFTDGEIIVRWEVGYTYERLDEDGKVIAAYTAKTAPSESRADLEWRDLIFVGAPTPGMEPIDAEAKEIMKDFKWADPMKDKYFGMTYAERLIFDKVTNAGQEPLTEVVKAMEAMMKQNQELIALLANPMRSVERRV